MSAPTGRVNVAFNDVIMEPDPAWIAIDQAHPNLVTSYTIDRGRSYELDRTDGGRATIECADPDGILDPTNPGSPYLGKINPLVQVLLCRWDPLEEEWQDRFRGWISDLTYTFDPSQQVNRLTIELVDMFDLLGAIEMTPSTFGDPASAPDDTKGSVFFENAATARARVIQVLGNSGPGIGGIPPDYYVVFSTNVALTQSVYSQGETPLAVIQDCADAEWSGVANVYCDRHGRLTVHGRYARFDPSGTLSSFDWSSTTAYGVDEAVRSAGSWYRCILAHTNHMPPNATYWKPAMAEWDFHHWTAGDLAAVEADAGTVAQLREFSFNRGVSKIVNRAAAYPQWILDGPIYRSPTDAEIAGQNVDDGSSIDLYGIRSWSAENLQTESDLVDTSLDGLETTKAVGQYYVANMAQPRNRITTVGFRSIRPGRVGSGITWNLLSRVDISDQIDITVTSPGGGGFAAVEYYVEGVHETATALNADYDDVTVRLDLSPKAYYDDPSMFPPMP